jgi:hypothetical protein
MSILTHFSRLFSPTSQFKYTKVEILRREIIRITAEVNALQRSMESVNSAIKDYEKIPDHDRIQEYQNLIAKKKEYKEQITKANEEISNFEEQLDEAIREQDIIEANKERDGWFDQRQQLDRSGGKSKKRKNKKNTKTKTKKNKSRQRLKKRR